MTKLYPFSHEIWLSNYQYKDEKTVADTWKRIAKSAASVENSTDRKEVETHFYNILSDFKFVPGGRILANLGTNRKSTTLMNCFHASANVLTLNGYKKIIDIEPGEYVKTHTGQWKRVVDVLSRKYTGNIVRLSSKYFTDDILVTPEHRFYVGEDNWLVADKLKYVCMVNFPEKNDVQIDLLDYLKPEIEKDFLEYDDEYINTKNKFSFYNNATVNIKSQKTKRFIKLNEDVSYFLGRFVADGSTWKNTKGERYDASAFNIVFNEYEQRELYKIKNIIKENFDLEVNINGEGSYNYLRKHNVIMALFLRRSIGKSSKTKRIPDFIWLASKKCKLAFLLGLFDGDGMVTQGGQLEIVLSNEKLIDDIQALLYSIDIPTKKQVFNTSYNSCNKSYSLVCNFTHLTIDFRKQLNKHYNDNRLEIVKNSKFILEKSDDNHVYLFEFNKEIEEYNDFVYNLSVEGDESYIVNNVVVHNCFVHAPKDIGYKDPDSIEGIYEMLKAQAHTLKSEGGYGMNFSWIRPKGTYIHGIDSRTPGVVKFMELWDKSSEIITMGSGVKTAGNKDTEKNKIRKGAMMGVLGVWHPEIVDFIKAKQVPNRLTKFNMSVGIFSDFMDKVKNNDKWELKFPDVTFEKYQTEWNGNIYEWEEKGYPVVVYETIKARELWDLIMYSTYTRNEPGVLFFDIANKLNPLWYAEYLMTTNPCLTGDTIIFTDKGPIPIKKVIEDGIENYKVLSYDIETGKTVLEQITWGGKTKENADIIKIEFDDNTKISLTPDHKIYTETRGWIEAQHLTVDDIILGIE